MAVEGLRLSNYELIVKLIHFTHPNDPHTETNWCHTPSKKTAKPTKDNTACSAVLILKRP